MPYSLEFKIQGYLEMLKDKELTTQLREELTKRLANTQALLDFSRKGKHSAPLLAVSSAMEKRRECA